MSRYGYVHTEERDSDMPDYEGAHIVQEADTVEKKREMCEVLERREKKMEDRKIVRGEQEWIEIRVMIRS